MVARFESLLKDQSAQIENERALKIQAESKVTLLEAEVDQLTTDLEEDTSKAVAPTRAERELTSQLQQANQSL